MHRIVNEDKKNELEQNKLRLRDTEAVRGF